MKYSVKAPIYIIVMMVFLIGCEGDEPSPENIADHIDGTDSNSTTDPAPAPSEVMPVGLWQGEINYTDGRSSPVVALVAPDGEARVIADDEQNKVMLELTNDTFTGKVTAFDYYGSYFDSGTIEGTYSSTDITGKATFNGTITSHYALTIAPESSNEAALSMIAGNYVTIDGETSIGIDSDGVFSGSNIQGCQYLGNLSVPDASINIYKIRFETTSCAEFNGTYTGLGTYVELYVDDPAKGLIFQVDNGNYSITNVLE